MNILNGWGSIWNDMWQDNGWTKRSEQWNDHVGENRENNLDNREWQRQYSWMISASRQELNRILSDGVLTWHEIYDMIKDRSDLTADDLWKVKIKVDFQNSKWREIYDHYDFLNNTEAYQGYLDKKDDLWLKSTDILPFLSRIPASSRFSKRPEINDHFRRLKHEEACVEYKTFVDTYEWRDLIGDLLCLGKRMFAHSPEKNSLNELREQLKKDLREAKIWKKK